MAGPNMEVFKFGFYMFFPIFIMYKFGDPVWYHSYVQPYKDILWPPYESTHKPPRSSAELHEELAKLKAQRLSRSGQTATASAAEPDLDSSRSASTTTTPPPSRVAQALQSQRTESSNRPPSDSAARWDWVDKSSGRLV